MGHTSNYSIPDILSSFVETDALVVRSPGRINLIGEHTDYNEGFVLPAAIDKAVSIARGVKGVTSVQNDIQVKADK